MKLGTGLPHLVILFNINVTLRSTVTNFKFKEK